MTVELFKNNIKDVLDDCIGIKMIFVDSDENIKDSNIDNEALARLKTNIVAKIQSKIVDNESLTMPFLSDADERKNALYEFDFEDTPLEFEILNSAFSAKAGDIEPYSVGDGGFDDISAIIIILTGRNGESITLYKHQYSVSILKSEQNALNLFKSSNRLVELDSNILKVDSNYVFLKFKDKFYIENLKTLESYFGFHDVIKNSAESCVEALRETNIIADIEPLVDRVESDDMAFSRKLAKVAKNSPVMGAVLNDDIISFAGRHHYLSNHLKLNDDGDKFILKTKKSQNYFLKLMSDDYLESELTSIQYDSLAKDKLE